MEAEGREIPEGFFPLDFHEEGEEGEGGDEACEGLRE